VDIARFSGLVALALASGCIQGDRRVGGEDGTTTDTTTDTTSETTTDEGVVPPSDTQVEADTSGCQGCVIQAACVPAATVNPDEPCQVCDPDRDAAGWSDRPDETTCDDGDPCTAPGSCFLGACAAPLLPSCGALPDCATDIVCDVDRCRYVVVDGACYIDEACREDGEPKPGNPCRKCDAGLDQHRWTDDDEATCDDDDACTYEDRCDGGRCAGTLNTCADQYACTLDFCDEGACVNQLDGDLCLIAGACRQDGQASADNGCYVCDSDIDQRQWSIALGQDCDDHDACTRVDTCLADGKCAGTRIVLGQEPNEEPSQADLLGEGVTSFPAGSEELNLNPLSDKDFFTWSMPLVALDGVRKPTARVKNDATRAMTACVYAACGQVLNSLVKPTVLCGELTPETLGPVAGCCASVPAGETRTVALEGACPSGGTVQQGMGFASVRFVSNVADDQGPACGTYTLEWGATLK